MSSTGSILLGILSIAVGIYVWLLTSGRVDPPLPGKERIKEFIQDRKILFRIIAGVMIFYGALWASHINELWA